MNHLMRTLISWSNLIRPKSRSGQIATLLIMVLILFLVFVLVTMNLGNVAIKSTTVSNAADSAVLLLASNLATKAKMLFEGLGGYEKCQKRGFLSILLAIVFAIIVTIICIISWGSTCSTYIIVFAMIAGAAGGMIGAAIAGTSILQGAVSGAAIGAAIGSLGAGIGEGIGAAGDFVWSDTALELSSEELAAEGWSLGGGLYLVPATIGYGSLALGALGVASTVYNQSVQYQMPSQILGQLQKDLSKLDEYSRYRESAAYTALQQVVDDPNKHSDDDDMNANGDRTELIPSFAWWWHRRMLKFAEIQNQSVPVVQNFLSTTAAFRDYIFMLYAGMGVYNPAIKSGHMTGNMERLDYKWSIDNQGVETAYSETNPATYGIFDGPITYLLQGLLSFGYQPMCGGQPCWQRGPSASQINDWMAEDCNSGATCVTSACTTCASCSSGSVPCGAGSLCSGAPAGYDPFDKLADGLRGAVVDIDGLVPPDFHTWINHFVANVNVGFDPFAQSWTADLQTEYNNMAETGNPSYGWQSWRYYYYNPQNPADTTTYYEKLKEATDYLTDLKNQLTLTLNSLPVCSDGDWHADATAPGGQVCGVVTTVGHWAWGYWPCCGWGYMWVNCVTCVHNWPCRLTCGGGTIDEDAGDEFGAAFWAIDDMITHFTSYRSGIKSFSDSLDAYLISTLDSSLGGLNPVTYSWIDARGFNSVVVQVGSFTMPVINKHESGNWLSGKVCMRLEHYTDEDNCWVKVTRYDPTNVAMGALGRWNPFARGITKLSRTYFAINQVGIKCISR